MTETTKPTAKDNTVWERWLSEFSGQFVIVEYYDGKTVSGSIKDYDSSHVALTSVQRKDQTPIPILANLSEVRFIRLKK